MRRFALATLVALALSAPVARAGLMIELLGSPVPVGSNTVFNYTIDFSTITAEERIEQGDFVTIYDVATSGPSTSFVSATAGPGWSVAVNNSGVNGPQTLPNDDASLLNVTYTYVGPAVSVDAVFPGFNIVSSLSGTGLDDYTSQRTDNLGPDAGTKVGEVGRVVVPAVPEPATLTLLATAASALFLRRRSV